MSEQLFQEAISHCRWKYAVRNLIPKIQLTQPKGTTFEQVFQQIYTLTKEVQGVGTLATYDLTAAVCGYNKIPINRVYIIGEGPQRAVKYLNLKPSTQKIGSITLKYITPEQVQTSGICLPPHLKSTTNGNALESFLCNWQKPVRKAYDLC